MSEQNQDPIENEQRPVVVGVPLVERSMLFDFMVLPKSEAETLHVQEEKQDSTTTEQEPAAVDLPVFDGQTQVRSPKSSFELDEHLKMLCDTELIEQIQSIPKRISFKIGEVADLVGVKSFVLRFWETEFDLLKPKKASNNQRMYSKKDVEVSFLIKKLLYRDRFSIEGARNVIKQARLQMKNEVSKIAEVSTTKQKIENLHQLQGYKIAEFAETSKVENDFAVDQLTKETICEKVDQISVRLNRLKELFS